MSHVSYAITGFFVAYSVYYLILFAATCRTKKTTSGTSNKTKFLVLIPAHNEEAVIGDICSDLLNQSYPRDLYRVIVVADNCTDGTARVVKGFGQEVLICAERRSEVKGKGAALDFALDNVRRLVDGFEPDYVVVFDADNRVPNDFLSSLSSNAKGFEAIQCNVKTKNPDSSWIARASYYEGLILQRLWQCGKDRLGLCAALEGTGEAIRYDVISRLKFGNSLTDDFDLTVRLAKDGIRVRYLQHPCTYDEKPDDVMIEVKRRIRWATGHFQTFFHNGSALLKKPSRLTLDAFFYFTNMISPLILMVSWATTILVSFGVAKTVVLPPALTIALALIIFPILVTVSWMEGDNGFLRNLPLFYALTALWLIAAPIGLVKSVFGCGGWDRTPHKFTSGKIGIVQGSLAASPVAAPSTAIKTCDEKWLKVTPSFECHCRGACIGDFGRKTGVREDGCEGPRTGLSDISCLNVIGINVTTAHVLLLR